MSILILPQEERICKQNHLSQILANRRTKLQCRCNLATVKY
nr:MAG TPA: hypothetical protein [Caudoviricetes sp.]